MASVLNLTKTHLAILNQAAERPGGRVLSAPADVANKGGRATRALKSLLQRGLIVEILAEADDAEWARNESGERVTLAVSPAGLAAVGLADTAGIKLGEERAPQVRKERPEAEPAGNVEAETDAGAPIIAAESVETGAGEVAGAAFRPGTKGAILVALLGGEGGATLPDLMEASGWRAHSVRGFLSGALRKKCGLRVTSGSLADGVRRYRIAA